MRHSDQPIYRPSQDLLGRSAFALDLARAIDQLVVARDGFVIALLGPWGSGKSSVIELTLRYMAHIEMERASRTALWGDAEPAPKTLEELEHLAETFDLIRERIIEFDAAGLNFSVTRRGQIRDIFKSWLKDDRLTGEAETYWRLISKAEQERRTIVVRFSPWLISGRAELAIALFSELSRSLGEKMGSEVRDAFASLLARVAELAPMAGAAIDLATGLGIGKVVSAGSAWSKRVANELSTGPTLDGTRERLRRALRSTSNQQMLVVIDDLDRLTPNEAREMVSLVKSLGDLPNVIYLLSYDDANLSRLISQGSYLDGHDFLKKNRPVFCEHSAHSWRRTYSVARQRDFRTGGRTDTQRTAPA